MRHALYRCQGANAKSEMFQKMMVRKYHECFPVKLVKVSCEDRAWFTPELKQMDRKQKREFSKHHKSSIWEDLNAEVKYPS